MALKLHTTYPGRFDSPSENYPQGKWRNRSNSTAHDGGYLEEKHMNDIYGFFGALLRNAEMSPNGEVDTAKKSQFYDALVTVAKSVVGEEGYRKLDDNVFNGLMTIKSDNDEQGVGISLQESDGTVRGQVVATDQGLQLTQYPKDGGSQTFTFPSEGGEVLLDSDTSSDFTTFPNKLYTSSYVNSLLLKETIEYLIPTDFADLNEGIEHIHGSGLYSQNAVVKFIYEDGYKIDKGIHLKDGDYSYIVVSTNAPSKIVQVSDDFKGVWSDDGKNSNSRNSYMIGTRCRMPTIDFILDQRKICNSGFIAYDQSTLQFTRLPSEDGAVTGGDPISGSINGIQYGVRARENSSIHCKNILATNNGYVGIYGNGNARIACEFSNVSGSRMGVAAARNTTIAADSIIAKDCTQYGIWAIRNSMITSEKGIVDGSNCGVYATLGGRVNFNWGSAEGCKVVDSSVLGAGCGVYSEQQGNLNIFRANLSNAEKYGIYLTDTSIANARSVTIEGGSVGTYVSQDSVVNLAFSKITGCTGWAVDADTNASFNAKGATILNNANGVRIRFGSKCSLQEANVKFNGYGVYGVASDVDLTDSNVVGNTIKDLRVTMGSIFKGTGYSTTSNTIDDVAGVSEYNYLSSNGILFKHA